MTLKDGGRISQIIISFQKVCYSVVDDFTLINLMIIFVVKNYFLIFFIQSIDRHDMLVKQNRERTEEYSR